jgi:hypothetical protein
VHLYEDFVDGKATDFHASAYRLGGRPICTNEPALAENDYLIEETADNEKIFYYWIGHKLADGAYMIFPLDEKDADDTTRHAACAKDQPEGICRTETYGQLVLLARATAAKPVRNAALAVILAR